MRALLRGTALTVAAAGAISCTAKPHGAASAEREYAWVRVHGGCDCGPVAFAPGSATPSWLAGQNLAEYVHDKTTKCASRQFVVTAFGDGGSNVADDTNLARARLAPFERRLRGVTHVRLDALVIAGPHVPHPSTLVILCPIDRVPAPGSF